MVELGTKEYRESLMKTYSPTELVFDKSWEEWIVKWWNHDFNYIAPVHLLVADYDGDMPSPVEIPKDREALLLSPINYIAMDDGVEAYGAMLKRAREEIDIVDPVKIKVQFDGMEIGQLAERVRTRIFQTVNGWGISDGYWIFLKGPFSKGPHKIESFGTCKSGQIQLSRSTDLLVV